MSSEGEDLRRARARLNVASADLLSAVARARTSGVLSEEEFQEVRRLIKAGRKKRVPTAGAMWHVAREFEERTKDLVSRLPAGAVEDPEGAAEYARAGHEPEGTPGTGGSRRRRKLATGQSVTSFVMRATAAGDGSRARASRRRNIPSLDELDDEQREQVARYHELMLLIEGGTTVQKALTRLGIKRSKSWVKKMRARYREHGLLGLLDGRWSNMRELHPDEVRRITLRLFREHSGAGPKAIFDDVVKICAERGLTAPSYSWVKWFLRHLPEGVKLARNKGMREWERQAAPVGSYDPTTYANEMWQIDHTRSDIWVRVQRRDGTWVPAEVWITAVLDVHSRGNMAFLASTKVPDAWTTALVLRKAILEKSNPDWPMRGVPTILVPDHGKDFKAHAVASSVRALGIRLEFCPPNYPNMKGEIERWFRTLQTGLFARLPGYKGAGMRSKGAATKRVPGLLTLTDLRREIESWIVNVYHRRPHDGISRGTVDRTPGSYWEETARVRLSDPRELDVLLLKSDRVRTVTSIGIRLKLKHTAKMVFWAPALVDHWRAKVRIRYNPEDLESILVYHADTGERIGEAWRMGSKGARYTIEDVKRERLRARRGVAERLSSYVDKVEQDDRQSPQAVQRHPLLRSWETASFTHPVLQFCCDFTSFPAGEGLPACCRSSPSSSRSR